MYSRIGKVHRNLRQSSRALVLIDNFPCMNCEPASDFFLKWIFVDSFLPFSSTYICTLEQGCQMVYFQTKNPNLVKFGRVCNVRCWYILLPFGKFSIHLLYFVAIWDLLRPFGIFFPRFGMLYREKSGNPVLEAR
jgi:hypothetical protein